MNNISHPVTGGGGGSVNPARRPDARPTFRTIYEAVCQAVPVRPSFGDGKPDYEQRLKEYYAWRDRQAGYIRDNGSLVGGPSGRLRHTYGERAARRFAFERHIRTVPRHDKSAVWAGIARHKHRTNPRRFNQPAFTPAFMMYRPAAFDLPQAPPVEIPKRVPTAVVQTVVELPKPVVAPVVIVQVSPPCAPITKRTISRPAAMWRPTPVRPPLRQEVARG